MKSIDVSELSQNPDVYVWRAATGERIEVTDHGRPVAVLGPPTESITFRERLMLNGELIPGTASRDVLLGEPLESGPDDSPESREERS